MGRPARGARSQEHWWLPSTMAFVTGLLHAGLLLPQLESGEPGSQLALTTACGAWWLAAGAFGLLRRGRIQRQILVMTLGHATAVSALGLGSTQPGVAWCTTMTLVTLPLSCAMRWSPALVRCVLGASAVGAALTTLLAVSPRAGWGFGLFAAGVTVAAVLVPTLLVLRIDARLRAVTAEALAQAVTDPLTGLLNRRGATQGLERLTGALQEDPTRAGSLLCLVALDVDHFKHVNDGFGHDVGDRVLVAVAGQLRQEARSGDLVVRFGGEEFAWLGTWPDAADAAASAERLRRAVAATAMPHGEPVTISLGVVAAPVPAPGGDASEALRELLRASDAALYAAKRAGRDRVVLAATAVGAEGAAAAAAAVTAGAAAP